MKKHDPKELDDTPTVVMQDARLAALLRESSSPPPPVKADKRIARLDDLPPTHRIPLPRRDPPGAA